MRCYARNPIEPIYSCLSQYCESTFPNAEVLDLHYKLIHTTAYDVLGFEGAPVANTIFPIARERPQPFSSFLPDANLTIGASMQGPFVGHVDYHDINVNKPNDGLPAHDASTGQGFRLHQISPSLSPTDDVSINKPYTDTPSVDGGNQLNPLGSLPFVPIAAAAATSVNRSASLPTSSISSPASFSQTSTTGICSPRRHVCVTCSKTFSRVQDMHRHARNHNPGAPRIDCPFPSCPYTGTKGFTRRDKLTSHWQDRHQ